MKKLNKTITYNLYIEHMAETSLTLENISKIYLENIGERSIRDGLLEMEIRFGTKGQMQISHIDYKNVVQKLKSVGFETNMPQEMLRINVEDYDIKTKQKVNSDVRININGMSGISKYCKENRLDISKTEFETKNRFITEKGEEILPVDIDNYGLRINLNVETPLNKTGEKVTKLLQKWNEKKKIFRYLSRSTLINPNLPVKVDMTMVKMSKRGRNHTIQESGVLNAILFYEIEIEVDSTKVGLGTKYSNSEELSKVIKTVIKYILCGIQNTNYPVPIKEMKDVESEYMKILWGKESRKKVYSSNFVGPSSQTLQIVNITDKSLNVPNIRDNYTVTDKADGDRKLLFITKTGKIYLIDTNMKIQYTGAVSQEESIFNTIIDGEHILYDKKGEYINLYAAFDIYYKNDRDVRNLMFMPMDDEYDKNKYRLTILTSIMKQMKAKSFNKKDSPIRLQVKTFKKGDIFEQCKMFVDKINEGLFEYETDGLIFTPANLAVGANSVNEEYNVKPKKMTWKHSFKWKPVENNTIDFLTTFKKTNSGQYVINNKIEKGVDLTKNTQVKQYKIGVLRVGYNENIHGYINPCLNIIEDKIPTSNNRGSSNYRPVQFYPTNPSDENAGICYIPITSHDGMMYTEEGDIIEDNTIIEYRYDMSKNSKWRWIPLRVRYDKTADFRSGGNNFGNAYHVANNNWNSIHLPITEEMITTGENIPNEQQDEVYYNYDGKMSKTKGLRDFHNKYIKNMLIQKVSKHGDTLIDMAVGKGGDIPKWIDANLSFVLGIDISRDNIDNSHDGVCARYLRAKEKNLDIPKAIFVTGDTSKNIRNLDAIEGDKNKQVIKAIFGDMSKESTKEIGKGVLDNHAIGAEGFDICSIQFAIHYMFKNKETLYNFIQNVSEITKVGGYFIGTSYDGKKMFDILKNVNKGNSVTKIDQETNTKIWEVTKQYDNTGFENDETSLGYRIDVYQETINKVFSEYLVNYTYLSRLLENYGFIEHSKIDDGNVKTKQLKDAFKSTSFKELFYKMKKSKENYGSAQKMSQNESDISFMNRIFIYKKVRNVDTVRVTDTLLYSTQSVEPEMKVVEVTEQKQNNEINATTFQSSPSMATDEQKQEKTMSWDDLTEEEQQELLREFRS